MRRYKPGCWADGTFGHTRVRARLADLVREFDEDLAERLLDVMSDDAEEEDEALAVLNDNTEYDTPVIWEFVDGDLMLSRLVSENSGE